MEHIPSSTYLFTENSLASLKISFRDWINWHDRCETFDKSTDFKWIEDINPQAQLLLLNNIYNPSIEHSAIITYGQKLLTYIHNIKQNPNNDFYVNEFIQYLFRVTNGSLYLFPQEKQEQPSFCIGNKVVTVTPNNHHSLSNEHIAGEVIANSYQSYYANPATYNPLIFGVKVIGLNFRFYKAIISSSYILSLASGLPTNPIIILCTKTYNYNHPHQRKRIISTLLNINAACELASDK